MAWTFLTNHTRVLLCIARNPTATRIRDIARCADITERQAHRIVADLTDAGYLTRHRLGARNFYEIHPDRPLRHANEQGHTIAEILTPLLDRPTSEASG